MALPIQMAISQAWNGVFQKFKNLKSQVLHALHIAKGLRSTGPLMIKLFKKGNLQRIFTVFEHLFSNVHTEAWSRVFFGGLLIRSIYLGILQI